MSYIRKTLTENETIIILTKCHWLFLFWPYFLIIFALLAFLIPCIYILFQLPPNPFYSASFYLAILLILFFISINIFSVPYLIKQITTEYAVTTKRIIFKSGFVWIDTDELRNTKLENIQIKQTIMGRVFNFGNLEFRGTGGSPVVFKDIPHPMTLKKDIENKLYSL